MKKEYEFEIICQNCGTSKPIRVPVGQFGHEFCKGHNKKCVYCGCDRWYSYGKPKVRNVSALFNRRGRLR